MTNPLFDATGSPTRALTPRRRGDPLYNGTKQALALERVGWLNARSRGSAR